MKEVDVKNQTQKKMSLKLIVQVLVQYEIMILTSPSITGVTYRDHFDFEERYRDVNECNPLYWHPLHLPPYCAEVFEKLIRARLATNTPVRIMTKRKKQKHHHSTYDYPTQHSGSSEYIYNYPYPMYQITSADYESYRPPLSPYEEVIELLRKDIEKDPSSPTVTVIPNLGPVALYKQGISRKSENRIKEMAEDYVKATKKMYEQYYAAYGKYPSEPEIFVYDSAKNKTKSEKERKKKDENKKQDEEKKNKVHRVRTKNGGVVTIIETKNLEAMKKDGPLF